jgi:uncharacterized membrane protein YgdD (TMEM256/DUF423 family)
MNASGTTRALGAVLGLSGVVLAALGSHAVPGMEDGDSYRSWQAASLLHLVHAPVLLLLGLQLQSRPSRLLLAAAVAIFTGAALFSGSIYARVVFDLAGTLNLAPTGGLILMGGWFACLVGQFFD